MGTDRRRARALFSNARFLVMVAIGMFTATAIYPPRPWILPSTILGTIAACAAPLCAIVATWWWRRDH